MAPPEIQAILFHLLLRTCIALGEGCDPADVAKGCGLKQRQAAIIL
jgi:hypothetical protein